MSAEFKKAIKTEQIKNIQVGNYPNVRLGGYIDGSVALSMELAIRYPDEVKPLPIQDKMVHIWTIFRYAEKISIKDHILDFRVDYDRVKRYHATGFHDMLPFLTNYSLITSYLFGLDDVKNCVLPWSIFKHVAPDHDPTPSTKLLDFLMKYRKYPNVLDNGTMGIREIHFRNTKFDNFAKFIKL